MGELIEVARHQRAHQYGRPELGRTTTTVRCLDVEGGALYVTEVEHRPYGTDSSVVVSTSYVPCDLVNGEGEG